MPSSLHPTPFQEVELKLSLPLADSPHLARLLARVPVLARRKSTRLALYNIYYDTPDQRLRQQRAVLRLRRVGEVSAPQWLQTFKNGTSDTSALSQRGEWESPLTHAALSREALVATPWSDMDADGSLFAALAPCFVTAFERTAWLVRRRDGSLVEVALDLGHIEANGAVTPICELELELKAGEPAALFDIAHEIARTVAVLPANMSKAQRGFLLAQGGLHQPHRAQTLRLSKALPVGQLAQQVLRSSFAQFSNNLESLRVSDHPEVVHQARVGWRRFKSALRLFKKILPPAAPVASPALRTFLASLGELRNLDVAQSDTLPALASAYVQDDAQRARSWQAMTTALAQATDQQRQVVRQALQQPDVGACLLAWVQWLENCAGDPSTSPGRQLAARPWAKRQIKRLNKRLADAYKLAETPEQWHQVRLLAKRLRYNSEDMQGLLPPKIAKLGAQQAAEIQSRLGNARDIAQVSALVAQLGCDIGLVEFLRGVAVGAAQP